MISLFKTIITITVPIYRVSRELCIECKGKSRRQLPLKYDQPGVHLYY